MSNNALDLLLGGSLGEVVKPTRAIKIKRLSNKEVDFVLNCEAINMDTFKHIQEISNSGKGMETIDPFEMQVQMVCYGVQEFQSQREGNKEKLDQLKKMMSVANLPGIVQKLLLPGEISQLAAVITELSGFNGDMVEDLKNE